MEEETIQTEETSQQVKYTKSYTYRHGDPANDLVRCYETSRIRVNTDFMCSLLKFAIVGGLLALIVGAIGSATGGIVGIGLIFILVIILLAWLIYIMSSAKNHRKALDAEELKELELLDEEENS